jgi:hypothetical protein
MKARATAEMKEEFELNLRQAPPVMDSVEAHPPSSGGKNRGRKTAPVQPPPAETNGQEPKVEKARTTDGLEVPEHASNG